MKGKRIIAIIVFVFIIILVIFFIFINSPMQNVGNKALLRGREYASKGMYENALIEFTKGINVNPDSVYLYMNRGAAYSYLGDYDAAISDYNKALELEPGNHMIYNNRALVYFEKGEYKKCWEDVHEVRELGYKVHPEFLTDLKKATEFTDKLEAALIQEGLVKEDFAYINIYYQNPNPDKLIRVLKVILTQKDYTTYIQDGQPYTSAELVGHLVAAVAQDNKALLDRLKDLEVQYSGLQQQLIQKIIAQTENFASPLPDSPENLDYLWAEFSATGKEEPVKKIISALSNPKMTRNKRLLSEVAEWSLESNAEQHKKVYEIIKNISTTATGDTRDKLIKILNKIEKEELKTEHSAVVNDK